MQTTRKLTSLLFSSLLLISLTSLSVAQVFQGNVPVIPPSGAAYPGQNYPAPQPPGFRGNWNNENASSPNGGLPVPSIVDPPAQMQVSDQKPGSMIVFPYYTSNAVNGSNTWVTISNTSPAYAVLVHLLFIEGVGCTQADHFICLTPNASLQMRASDIDPDIRRGWILGVAVNQNGQPTQANVLTGTAFVVDNNSNGFRYEGNYGAESFTAYSNAPTFVNSGAGITFAAAPLPAVLSDPACRYDSVNGTVLHGYNGNGYVPGLYDNNGTTAALNLTGPPTFCYARDVNITNGNPGPATDIRTFQLNGGGYDLAPNRFVVEIQSPADVPGQLIVTAGLSGNLDQSTTAGGQQVGTGVVVNGNETPLGSFVNLIVGRCQSLATISNTEPRVPRGMNALIPTGQVGTLSFNATAAVGLILTPRNNKGASGIRALHKTRVNSTQELSTVARGGGFLINGPNGLAVSKDAILRYGVQLVIPVFIPPSCWPQIPQLQ